MVGAARVDREPERHRLQRARLVAGQLQALDVRRERRRALADDLARRRASPRPAGRRGPRARRSRRARAAAPSASPKRSHGASIRPRSAHSIAQAIVPPAEIVSRPSSSQRPLASSTASGSDDAAQRAEREHVLVLDARPACRRRPCRCARSRSSTRRSCRARRRAPRRGPRRRARGASANVAAWKLRVGSVAIALNASRLASVPSSRYFAVAGPNERSRRSRAAASTACGSAGATFVDGADRDRLEVLGAEHRAEAAAAGVAAVVRDRRVPDAGARPPGRSTPPATPGRAARAAAASASAADRPQRSPAGSSRGPSPSTSRTDGSSHAPRDDDRVVAGELARDGEVAGGERVVEQPGQRRLGDDGELRAGRQRRADQRARSTKASGASGPSGSTPRRRELGASARRRGRRRRCSARRTSSGSGSVSRARVRDVDDERAPEVAAGDGAPAIP